MGKWVEVARCEVCGKIYPNGVEEICRKCSAKIATRNNLACFLGIERCMTLTNNCKRYAVYHKLFGKYEKELIKKIE